MVDVPSIGVLVQVAGTGGRSGISPVALVPVEEERPRLPPPIPCSFGDARPVVDADDASFVEGHQGDHTCEQTGSHHKLFRNVDLLSKRVWSKP